jgi:uncharacterized membrane protein HdeD (DUF308 family)
MTHQTSMRPPARSSWWAHALLGAALVAGGVYVLGNVVAATLVTVTLLGGTLVAVGIFEAFSSFWAKGWGGFMLNLVIGVLYAIAGVVLLYDPIAATAFLTLLFSISLVVSGFVRIALAFRYWRDFGWLLVASGFIGVMAGLVILSGWPFSGLWVFGVVLGVDLIIYGAWWVAYAVAHRHDGTNLQRVER